jgi:enterobacterial common antigen flippase
MATVPCSNELDVSSLESLPQPATTQPKKQSYGQILKSSALVGGSSVLNVGIGIVRTKAMAMLLGPAGFGLFGLYGSVADLSLTVAGLGVNSSGVRQIAQAVGTADVEEIALTTVVLRRASVVLGVLGAILLCVFSRQVSNATFGTAAHQGAICLLSLAVFFRLVSAGQGALIQGMRRIRDLAKMQVLGALSGTLISIALVYKFRDNGVVPALVGVAAMTIVTSWWYSRKIEIQSLTLTLSQTRKEASELLKLGLAFMSSGLMTMGVAYGTRITILHKLGVEATGMYQAAWTLGGLYVGFILQAMAADFYPRLTAKSKDNDECNRLVNEQALVGLLLAGPGVIATLTFAPVVIALLYSAKFGPAVGILRWICLGATLQVITWPMGFIIVAKGRPAIFFIAECSWTVAALGLTWVCVRSFGLNGAGIAFFASYVFHFVLIYPIVNRLSGFRWSSVNGTSGLFFLSLIAVVFCGFYVLPTLVASAIGTLALAMSVAYSLRTLLTLIPSDRIPRQMRRLLIGFGLDRVASTPAS